MISKIVLTMDHALMGLESFVDRLADSEQNLYRPVSLRFHLEISRTGLVKDGRMTNDCRAALQSRKFLLVNLVGCNTRLFGLSLLKVRSASMQVALRAWWNDSAKS